MKASNPKLSITGTGKQTYLWIGNDTDLSKGCFATKSGKKTLEKFAKDLLKALSS